MKFKVGDRVKAVDNIGLFPNGALGIVGIVDPIETRQGYFVHFDDGKELWCWTDKTEAAPVASHKIVITADGKTTLARLYDGDMVVKSKEAKCSPTDTFSFQAGAALAFKRLFENPVEKQDKPKVDKPKFSWEAFKSGKIAVHCDTEEKAKEFCAAARERFPDKFRTWGSGETNWEKYGTETRYGISGQFCYGTWGFDGYTIIDYPFSPAPEPKTEPVKLYCTLDGYQPEEKKPEYYNGKVVCVECPSDTGPYTPGKIYTFKDGFTCDDNGDKRPSVLARSNPRTEGIHDFDDWKNFTFARFIEYRGEA